MKKSVFIIFAAGLLASCGTGPVAEQPRENKDSLMAEEKLWHGRDNNSVTFTIGDKEYTYMQSEMGGMYFKSVTGMLSMNFMAPDERSSVGLVINDFGAVTGPRELGIEKDHGKSNFVMYIPYIDPNPEKSPAGFASTTGKIVIKEIDWKNGWVTGTFEAAGFEDDDTGMEPEGVGAIKGSFYKCSFKEM